MIETTAADTAEYEVKLPFKMIAERFAEESMRRVTLDDDKASL